MKSTISIRDRSTGSSPSRISTINISSKSYTDYHGKSNLMDDLAIITAELDSYEQNEEQSILETEEKKFSWTSIFTLPYEPVWCYTVMILGCLDVVLTFVNYWVPSKPQKMLDWVCDVLYAIDAILCGIGKNNYADDVPLLAITMPYWVILVSFVSCFPGDYLRQQDIDKNLKWFLTAVNFDLLKFIKPYYHLYLSTFEVGLNGSFIECTRGVLKLMFLLPFCFFLSSIAYCPASLPNCDPQDYRFERFAYVMSTVTLNCYAPTPNQTATLHFITIIMTVWSFYLVFSTICSLTIDFTNNKYNFFVFVAKKERAKIICARYFYNNENVVFYIKMIDQNWYMQRARALNDAFLKLLPPSIKQELAVDINWPALKHSKLFQNMDLPFLRKISLCMKQEFAYTGECVFEKGKRKMKMVYIVSGIVQLISEADGVTPFLSFSQGSVFGETSLFISYDATTDIRCKTPCEFHVLYKSDLTRLVKHFPKQFQKLRRSVLTRYERSERLKKVYGTVNEEICGDVSVEESTSLWLKSTLHKLMATEEEHVSQNIFIRDQYKSVFPDMLFCATYLDMLAITRKFALISDTVFIKKTFPWIFQPDCIIVKLWKVIVFFFVLSSGVVIPYLALIKGDVNSGLRSYINFCDFIYWSDIVMELLTAQKTTTELLISTKTIFMYKLGTIHFWLDILAAYPFEMYACLFIKKSTEKARALLQLNRMLKLHMILSTMSEFCQRDISWRVLMLMLYFKHALILFFAAYLTGAWLYFEHCLHNVCEPKMEGHSELEKFFWYFSAAGSALSFTGISTPYVDYHGDYWTYFCIMILAVIIFVDATSEVNALYVLSYSFQIELAENIVDVGSALNAAGVKHLFLGRLVNYIDAHYQFNKAIKFLTGGSLFKDMLLPLLVDFREHIILDLVSNSPMFQGISYEALIKMSEQAVLLLLPRGELVTFTGCVDRQFYIIRDGCCKVLGENRILKKGYEIAVIEACLGLPIVHTIIADSCCELVCFKLSTIKALFTEYPEELAFFKATLADFTLKDEVISLMKQNIKYAESYTTHPIETEQNFSFVKFDRKSRKYIASFRKYSILRYFLMPITITPMNRFIIIWESQRSFFAFISSILFVINPIVNLIDSYDWLYVLCFLDLTTIIDMYVRLHICYYNEKGILVSHPFYTACHYVNNAFLLDLLAMLPIHTITINETEISHKLVTFLQTNHLLQMYRFIGLFKVTIEEKMPINKSLYIFKFLPVLIVVCNYIAAIMTNFNCDFHADLKAEGKYGDGVKCQADSFIGQSSFQLPMTPLSVHLIGVYFVTSVLTLSGIQGFELKTLRDSLAVTLIGFVGLFCLFTLVGDFVAIFSSKNSSLLYYQVNLSDLKTFMRKKKLRRNIQSELISHFEVKWYRRKGRNLQEILKKFTDMMNQDILWSIYGKPLELYSVFPAKEARPFYRRLLMEMDYDIVGNGRSLTKVNVINSTMYIIFKGLVDVIAPDGSKIATLGAGSMCGNLDNAKYSRQTVSFVANGLIEILRLDSLMFHKILKDYPSLKTHFQELTMMHIDYLPGHKLQEITIEKSIEVKIEKNRIWASVLKWYYKVYDARSRGLFIWKVIFILIICYLQCIWVLFLIAVDEKSWIIFILLHCFDLLFLLDVFLKFRTTYEDDSGIIIRELNLIRKKTIRDDKLYLIISGVAIIPLDVLPYLLPHWKYNRILQIVTRLPKLLRFFFVTKCFQESKSKLNVNLYVVSLTETLSYTYLFLHILTCVFILSNCADPTNFNPPLKFPKHNRTDIDYVDVYAHGMYIIVCCVLHKSQSHYHPISNYLIFLFIVYMFLSCIAISIFCAKLHAIVKMSQFLKLSYTRILNQLKHVLQREEASITLASTIWRYLRLLWRRKRGSVFPKLIEESPATLRTKVLNVCYAHHISKHVLFKGCHRDFVAQMVNHLKPVLFFPGDYVCFKGNIDETMYFVESGEVLVLTEDASYKETTIGLLRSGYSFGMMQGIMPMVPHAYTFKARSVLEVLTLERSKWVYLLGFFPASNDAIFDALEEYNGY